MPTMLGRKPAALKEGLYVFLPRGDGEYKDFAFGAITGVDGDRMGVNGLLIDPVGLKNKVEQGKAGPRSVEILQNPTAQNAIFALIYRVEQDNFTEVMDTKKERFEVISPKSYSILDGWIREEIPELINNVLSLPPGPERDTAKRTLKQKGDTLLDKDLRRNLYSVSRSLKILSNQ
ncbi:hypothetical protein CENSYa_1252 [Cenarchaeum symbiosum A]|uniref:Uncharacterized protein n=1 Tax=Cenarchaeum symbiosum (strain A) TaxID=414004 RepID=A0RX08_CENSY|nr:hypothetical protein CENSYa_1252 [Cenarchaeum symbiosum A]